MKHVITVLALFDGPAWQEVDEVASFVKWVVFVGLVPGGHFYSVVCLKFFQVGPYFLDGFAHYLIPMSLRNLSAMASILVLSALDLQDRSLPQLWSSIRRALAVL